MVVTTLKNATLGKLSLRKHIKISDYVSTGTMPIRHFNFNFDAKTFLITENNPPLLTICTIV